MNYQIVDNFISQESLDRIQNSMLALDDHNLSYFPWFTSRSVASTSDDLSLRQFYMVHPFYWEFHPASDFFHDLLVEMIVKLQPNAIIRVKGNLYPATDTILEHEPHVDFHYSHKGALFFVNTNDGYTTLADGTKIESVENRMLFFDPSEPHFSSNCTNDKFRVTINFNYF